MKSLVATMQEVAKVQKNSLGGMKVTDANSVNEINTAVEKSNLLEKENIVIKEKAVKVAQAFDGGTAETKD